MTATTYSPRLKVAYNASYRDELIKELDIKNANQLPKLQKITVNVGMGKSKEDKKSFEVVANTLKKITGQAPVDRIAKKSIASFKLREGQKIGMMVTLRGDSMYEFADRLIHIVLPRLRDFHGVSAKAFDKQGNYSLGLRDQSVFPELTFEDTTNLHGLQVTFVIRSEGPEHSKALLEKMGMPFEKERK